MLSHFIVFCPFNYTTKQIQNSKKKKSQKIDGEKLPNRIKLIVEEHLFS